MTAIVSLLLKLGPAGVFFGMIGESAGLPLPSEVLLPFAGWMVFVGRLSFLMALVLAVLAQVVGSVIGYGIGRYGGRPALEALERVTGRKELAMAEDWFGRFGPAAVFWGRFLPVVRTFISWPAGLARMGMGRFLVLTFLGSIPWTAALILAGDRLGAAYTHLGKPFHTISLIVALLLVLLILYWLLRRFTRRAGEAKG